MDKTYIPSIIIYKLSHWWEPIPIVPFEVNKNLKLGFYSAISLFYLAISLKIKSY